MKVYIILEVNCEKESFQSPVILGVFYTKNKAKKCFEKEKKSIEDFIHEENEGNDDDVINLESEESDDFYSVIDYLNDYSFELQLIEEEVE